MAVRARRDNLALDHPAAGDPVPADFDELWQHHRDVRAVSRRVVGEGQADDVVQDTYLRALNAEQLERRRSFGPWLATVARRRSIDELRAGARLVTVATPPERSTTLGDDPLEQVLVHERSRRVRAALATLAPRERRLLLRQAAHGLSLGELAADEATSIASVRSVLARARTKLRSSLERGGPLGVAPLPRLVAAVRRRLQDWAVRIEGAMPSLAGAGAHLGDVMGAAVAAIALLLAGNVPAPESHPAVSLVAVDRPPGRPAPDRPPPNHAEGGGPPRSASGPHEQAERPQGGAGGGADKPLVPRPSLGLPGLPADEADQPEEVYVEHVAASDDGRTLVISGNKDTRSGSKGGMGLYRSDDGGHTWRWLEAGGYAYGNPVIPPGFDRHGTLFVAADPLVLRSDDGGRSFEPVGSSRNGVTAVSSDPDDSRMFLAPAGLVAYDVGTGHTTPYGAAPTAAALGGLATAGDNFVVGTALHKPTGAVQGYVQRCTVHLCEQPVALPQVFTAPKVFAPTDTPGLVLAWGSQRLYRSVDGGVTFTAVSLPPTGTIFTVVDGAEGELLLARSNRGEATSSGLLRSSDGGLTWTPLALGTPLQQGAEGLAYLATGRIVAGIDGAPGFRCSTDGGVTWAARCPA
jgi:RNA polymerase sigma factor (sigma-70 family)